MHMNIDDFQAILTIIFIHHIWLLKTLIASQTTSETTKNASYISVNKTLFF